MKRGTATTALSPTTRAHIVLAAAVLAGAYATSQAYAESAPGGCAAGVVEISNADELSAALADTCPHEIGVRGVVSSVGTIRLAPGQRLVGVTDDAAITFPPAVDGIQLTSDNTVSKLRIQADPAKRAIFNDTAAAGLGTVKLVGLTTTGQVQLLAKDQVRSGNVTVDGLDIVAADTSSQEKPRYVFYGSPLESREGAFQLWNRQPDADSVITADLRGISVGRPDAPVVGSGVSIFGATPITVPTPDGTPIGDVLHDRSQHPTSGSVRVSTLETGALHTDGGLNPLGTDRAQVGSGAVFIGAQAPIDRMHVGGPITTRGLNAGGVDLFSDINSVTFDGPIETFGPTGIAIVSWPHVGMLTANGPVTTHGLGARGLNVYAGHIDTVRMHDISTDGPGSPAIDVFADIDDLGVDGRVTANGLPGPSLVLGNFTVLPSDALHVAEGGNVDTATVTGPLRTTAPGTSTVLVGPHSRVGTLCVAGGIEATGLGSKPVDNQGTLILQCPA
ncbi:hypothetical protein [Nocardia sp. NPDC052112]|uniref:hypothetical protein n=1 Tax=Nocardia sp. NPDC052112 TaxID=3155646 RepID=UPI003416DBB9